MSQPSIDSNLEMTSAFADGEEKIAVHNEKSEEDLKAEEAFTKGRSWNIPHRFPLTNFHCEVRVGGKLEMGQFVRNVDLGGFFG